MSEQEDVELAIYKIERYIREHLKQSENGYMIAASSMAWACGTKEIRKDGRVCNVPTGENSEWLALLAKQDGAAWEACVRLASACVERGEPVPEPIRQISIDYLRGAKGPSAKSRWGRLHRDLVLCNGIAMLEKAGIYATRNDETENKNSGCDIVAGVACISYSSMKAIWLKYRGHVYEVNQKGPFYFTKETLKLLSVDHYQHKDNDP